MAGWGGAVALVGGVIAYLWLASDSIEAELKEQRPQITITVKPKRRNIEPPAKTADAAPKRETSAESAEAESPEREGAEASSQSESLDTADLKAGLSRVLGKTGSESEAAPETQTASAAPEADKAPNTDEGTGAPTGNTMHPHPDLKLIEETDQGPLPKIDEAGRQPWKVYSRPFNKADKRARIAVVVTQLGLSPQLTQQSITELPGPVTLGFAPYARSLGDWVQQARDNGHEVLIGLPMEPSDYPRNDPGPNGLMLANSIEENTKRMNWVLSRATGYIGVFNFMGSRFSVDRRALKPIVQNLKDRGLMFLDMRATPFSVLGAAAQEVGLPYSVVDLSPDADPSRGAIDRSLADLAELAAKNKSAIATVRPLPITMLRLKRWISRMDTEKFVLVPLSAITRIANSKT